MLGESETRSAGQKYVLCIGINNYTNLQNSDLRYAENDAQAVAAIFNDPSRGSFNVTLKTDTEETTKIEIEKSIDVLLNNPKLKPEDLVIFYIS